MTKRTSKVQDTWIRKAISLDISSRTSQLLQAILDTYEYKEVTVRDEVVSREFEPIKGQIEKDIERDKERSIIYHRNIIKRWEAKRRTEAAQSRVTATKPDSVPYVEAEVMERFPFVEFWSTYDKMRNRKECEWIWHRLSDADKARIMRHVPQYVASTGNKKYRKDPITYLKNRGWEDEIIEDLTDNEHRQRQTAQANLDYMARAAANIQFLGPSDADT